MKKLNILLIALTTLFLASCSLISNNEESSTVTTESGYAVFRLDIGESSRVISPAEKFTVADLTDIAVTFTNEETNKQVTGIPTETNLSWYIPQGTYTVSVTAKAKELKVAGTTSGVEVTKEGGSASIKLGYVREGSGSFSLNLSLDTNSESFSYLMEYIEEVDDKYISEDSDVYTVKNYNLPVFLHSINKDKVYKLNATLIYQYINSLQKSTCNIEIISNEQIPAGYYNISLYYYNKPKFLLKDNIIQILPDATTTGNLEFSKLVEDISEDYATVYLRYDVIENGQTVTFDQQPFYWEYGTTIDLLALGYVPNQYLNYTIDIEEPGEGQSGSPQYKICDDGHSIVIYDSCNFMFTLTELIDPTTLPSLPVAIYRNTLNGEVYIPVEGQESMTQYNGYNFFTNNNVKYFISKYASEASTYQINIPGEAALTLQLEGENKSIIDFTVSNDNKLYFVYSISDINKIYSVALPITDGQIESKTLSVSGAQYLNGSASSDFGELHIACSGDDLYYVTSNGKLYKCGGAYNIADTLIKSISFRKDVYVIKDFEIYNEKAYILVSYRNSDPLASSGELFVVNLTSPSESNSYGYADNNYELSDNYFFGPCKILGLNDSTIYISDEGVYGDFANKNLNWRSRVMTFSIGSDEFKSSIPFSYKATNSNNHFEYNYLSTGFDIIAK